MKKNLETKEKCQKRIRYRIFGISIGQIDKDLIEVYKKMNGLYNMNYQIKHLISKEIIGREVKTPADLALAQQIVQKMYYHNIGEYLEAYIRDQVLRKSSVHEGYDF